MPRRPWLILICAFLAAAFFVTTGCSSGGDDDDDDDDTYVNPLLGTWMNSTQKLGFSFLSDNSGYRTIYDTYQVIANSTLVFGPDNYSRVTGSGDTIVGSWLYSGGTVTLSFEANTDFILEMYGTQREYGHWETQGTTLYCHNDLDYDYSEIDNTVTIYDYKGIFYTLNGDNLSFFGYDLTRTAGNPGELEGSYETLFNSTNLITAEVTATNITLTLYSDDTPTTILDQMTGTYTVQGAWILWDQEYEYTWAIAGNQLYLTNASGTQMFTKQ